MTLAQQFLDPEQRAALERLKTQLEGCGVRAHVVAGVLVHYESALQHRSPAAWQRFYRALFTCVEQLSLRSKPVDRATLESVLAILEDDFGSRLFDRAALARIRGSYSEVYGRARGREGAFASREAYLPS